MNKLLVILGPTSTGKTDLAIALAKKFDGELISADSRQVYKKLDIGTGKLPRIKSKIKRGEGFWEINDIKVWMYDAISPKRQYTVADFSKDAERVISKVRQKGKIPILVGGTGLYIKAIADGLSNLSIPLDGKLRKSLQKLSLIDLQKKLLFLSAKKWEMMNNSDKQNPRRLIRAIELEIVSKEKIHTFDQGLARELDILKIGLVAQREILYRRSDARVVSRIDQGMIEESIRLKREGVGIKRMKQLGLEYGVLADFLDGKIKTKVELAKILQNKIHGYIKRQLTWFKKEKNVFWFDISKKDFFSQVEKKVHEWYY